MIKRRRYLVNRPMQFRYMSLVAVPLVLLSAAIYYLIYYSVFSELVIPEAIASALLPAMKKANLVLAIAFPVALFVIIRWALIYSNRIVGPIPRLEREIDKVLDGDLSVRIKTRDKDELSGFVNKVNMLLERIEKAE